MIKAIIFDCFGVVRTDSFRDTYIHFGGDPDADADFIHQVIQDGSAGKIKSSGELVAEHLGITLEEWLRELEGGQHVQYDVLEYAGKLREKYKVAMLSNIGSAGLKRFFEPGLLERYFDPIVESAAIGWAKPESQAYEITADRLGVRLDECVFIDDRQDYVDGAVAVGMQAILYKDLTQLKSDLAKLL